MCFRSLTTTSARPTRRSSACRAGRSRTSSAAPPSASSRTSNPIPRRKDNLPMLITGFSSQIGTKLRDWAVGQAGGSCYSWAALSSNDSKTRYISLLHSGIRWQVALRPSLLATMFLLPEGDLELCKVFRSAPKS